MINKFDNFNEMNENVENDIVWTTDEIKKLIEYYEAEKLEAEEEIDSSSYPPNEQKTIDESQKIIWLLNDMLDKKSWMYRFGKDIKKN